MENTQNNNELNGIGGWLILFIVRICIGLIQVASPLMMYFSVYFSSFLGLAFIASIGLYIAVLIFLFKRKIIFRTLYVISAAIITIILLANDAGTSGLASFLAELIWCIYLFKSKRVAITFGTKKEKVYNESFSCNVDLRENKSEQTAAEVVPIKEVETVPEKVVTDAAVSMFCKYCGKAIDDDSTFCRYCGKHQ